jgi:exopolysaccharide biosynthesis polyprenyl glycosylphosphotransferase
MVDSSRDPHPELVREQRKDWGSLSREWAIPAGRHIPLGYVFTDLCLVFVNAYLAYALRFFDLSPSGLRMGGPWRVHHSYPAVYIALLFLYAVFTLLFCKSRDLYRTPSNRTRTEESLAVGQAVALATVPLVIFIHLAGLKTVSGFVVTVAALLNAMTFAGWRLWKRRVVEGAVGEGRRARNVLIVGAGKTGQDLARFLETNKHLGYVVRGFIDQDHLPDPRVLGKVESLTAIAHQNFIDEIFITIPSQRELVRRVALAARDNRWDLKIIPELYDGLGLGAPLDHLGRYPIVLLHREPIRQLELLLKRVTDLALTCVALSVSAPLMLSIAIGIKLESQGPVLYRSVRLGKKGRKFICYKFRTMVANADTLKPNLRHINERHGPFFKLANDPRVTRFGKWLRKYSLDELPQFWNVLKGDMSLVGPRPHPLDDCAQYTPDHLRRLDVTPGLTGLWQVKARRDPSFENNMALDLQYIERWSLWTDAKILLQTIPVVLQGAGQ